LSLDLEERVGCRGAEMGIAGERKPGEGRNESQHSEASMDLINKLF
jgi:hypothetical protein